MEVSNLALLQALVLSAPKTKSKRLKPHSSKYHSKRSIYQKDYVNRSMERAIKIAIGTHPAVKKMTNWQNTKFREEIRHLGGLNKISPQQYDELAKKWLETKRAA